MMFNNVNMIVRSGKIVKLMVAQWGFLGSVPPKFEH